MSTAPQAVTDIPVRNLYVIDFLAKWCKWCGTAIFDSSTKPRKFCNNNNVCCNAFSRSHRKAVDANKRKIDHAGFEMVERSALYTIGAEKNIGGYEKPVQKFRRAASPSAHVRIPKFGGGLRPSGISVQIKRVSADTIDVMDRLGVSARDDVGYDNRANLVAPLKVKDHLPRPRIKK